MVNYIHPHRFRGQLLFSNHRRLCFRLAFRWLEKRFSGAYWMSFGRGIRYQVKTSVRVFYVKKQEPKQAPQIRQLCSLERRTNVLSPEYRKVSFQFDVIQFSHTYFLRRPIVYVFPNHSLATFGCCTFVCYWLVCFFTSDLPIQQVLFPFRLRRACQHLRQRSRRHCAIP